MEPVYRPGNDTAPHWRPRLYADDDEASIDQAARALAISRRRAVAGIMLGLIAESFASDASGKRNRRRKRCGKGLKRCPDGKCYLKAKTCCPKRWGGGVCWEAHPVCCPPKKGKYRTPVCVDEIGYCTGCATDEIECPANSNYPFNTCNAAGSVCCPNSAPCPADFPICCLPDDQSPYGYCMHEGDACFT